MPRREGLARRVRRPRGAGPLAAAALRAALGSARRIDRDAARRRADDGAAAREARAHDGRRPALAAPEALRGAGADEEDLRPLRRRRGGHRGGRPLDVESPARSPEDPHHAGRGRDRRDQGDVVQPAVARGEARAGRGDPHSRTREPARLRRLVVRSGRRRGDRRLRARLSGDRGRRAEDAARPPRAGARARPRPRRRPAGGGLLVSERLPLRADALAAVHRPRSLPEAEVGRTRLAFDELLVLRLALLRTAATRARASAQRLGPPGELMARYRESLPFTLTPDQERAMAEIDRRSRPLCADAAPAAGRRRLGQDGRARLHALCARSRPAIRAR